MRCKATTTLSRRCKSNTTNENGLCHSHQPQPQTPYEQKIWYEKHHCGCIRVCGGRDINKTLKCADCQLSEFSKKLGKPINCW